MSGQTGMKPIWYFVGLVLITMGGLLFIAGMVDLISPPARITVLAEMHTSLWWGLVMLVVGLIFFLRTRKTTIS
jgi:FtsH-binding integral membrane protein